MLTNFARPDTIEVIPGLLAVSAPHLGYRRALASLREGDGLVSAHRRRAAPDRTQMRILGVLKQKLHGPVPLAAS